MEIDMYYETWEKIAVGFVVVTIVPLVLWLLVMTPFIVQADKVCAENGWPTAEVQYNLDQYCVREIDETEYICLLDDVLADACVFDYED